MEYLLLIGGFVILLFSGKILVRGATWLALRFNISTLVVGVTVVSLGTSAPELVISLQAALNGHPDISIGNIVGSNIANLGLVLGITAIIFHVNVSENSIRIDWPVMMIASLAFCYVMSDLVIVRWEGLVFTIAIIAFVVWLIIKSRKEEIERTSDQKVFIEKQSHAPVPKIMAFIILGCAGLALGAKLLVDGAIIIAENIGISERVIGLTVIAFGTSAPELTTSLVATFKKESNIAFGNLIGSNIFNILGIIGVTALVTDIPVLEATLDFDVYWMLGISVLVLPFMIYRRQVRRIEGVILLALYITYIAFLTI
ncbi:MAG TPA: calcium/sodium antiporter [Flavobacteriales bacterium]|nr:calcium/sodium antiporter [Flavobacteriales bacterium]